MQAEKFRYTALGHGLCAVAHLTQRSFDVDAPPRCVVSSAALSADVVYLDVLVWPAGVVWFFVSAWSHNLVARLVPLNYTAAPLPGLLVWHVLTAKAACVVVRITCQAVRVGSRRPSAYNAGHRVCFFGWVVMSSLLVFKCTRIVYPKKLRRVNYLSATYLSSLRANVVSNMSETR